MHTTLDPVAWIKRLIASSVLKCYHVSLNDRHRRQLPPPGRCKHTWSQAQRYFEPPFLVRVWTIVMTAYTALSLMHCPSNYITLSNPTYVAS